MDIENAVANLKERIRLARESTTSKLAPNVRRGHLRSISTDIEDAIGLFVSEIAPEGCSVLLDPSIHVGGKNNRPDMLIVRKDGTVAAMVEIKANMGWCRNASWVIDDIIGNDAKFRSEGTLHCEFSKDENVDVTYADGVKLFLVSLVDGNCPPDKHEANKLYASSRGVLQMNLFAGWYDSLGDLEIRSFAQEVIDTI